MKVAHDCTASNCSMHATLAIACPRMDNARIVAMKAWFRYA